MDCPSCGLANPPEALKCDCGYDFSAGKAADFPGWEISIAWRQKVAAFWSISWPAWIGSMGLIIGLTSGYSVDLLQDNFSVIALGGNLAFFAIQALLTRRLVRKNYRSFRLYVVRDDGSKSRNLSIREAVSVWLWILWPQLALLLLMSVVFSSCMVLGCEASSGHRPRVLLDVAMDSFPGHWTLRRRFGATPKVSGVPAGGPRVSVRISAGRWQLADARRCSKLIHLDVTSPLWIGSVGFEPAARRNRRA